MVIKTRPNDSVLKLFKILVLGKGARRGRGLSFFLFSCGEAKTQKEGERREEEELERRARNDRQKYPQTLHREIERGGVTRGVGMELREYP